MEANNNDSDNRWNNQDIKLTFLYGFAHIVPVAFLEASSIKLLWHTYQVVNTDTFSNNSENRAALAAAQIDGWFACGSCTENALINTARARNSF